jgi:ethanolamine ammonia-lyase large subunit
VSTNFRQLFVLANAFKEGDLLVGGTRDDRIRQDARRALQATRLGSIRRTAFVDDGVSAAIERGRNHAHDPELDVLTVEQVKSTLLGGDGTAWARHHRESLPSEVCAAIVKVMTNDELARVARQLTQPLLDRPGAARDTGNDILIGGPGHFGSRIQPNSPGDDEEEILFSILEGLTYGCGDVIIGLNPAADELDTIVRLEQLLERVVTALGLPTRYCVLSDIVKQHQARAQTRVDVGFQSLAGTSRALTGIVGLDADGIADLARAFDGLYFETGQGSAVTNGAAEGVDMVTLESRAYGLARAIRKETGAWMIVNDVAGFIGPEVFRSAEQLERACLEDLVMARLHGITMGLDVCATFHMGLSPTELRAVTDRIVRRAAPVYLMAVAGNADPMLGYLTTAFRDHPPLRQHTGRRITSTMARRLEQLGGVDAARLYAMFAQSGRDRRSTSTLEEEGRRKLGELRERGFDLATPGEASESRLDAIYQNARHALYATVEDGVIRDACASHIHVRTDASDRDDYLAHPAAGERICREHAGRLHGFFSGRPAQMQLVVSDGLNANAANEQLRLVLPLLRRLIRDGGFELAPTDVIVQNGRVRAGYHIGQLAACDVIVHLIGERPGTGLNMLSAYLTFGRDNDGRLRWAPELDHSCTTAVCGIHPRGKPPETAAHEIARTLARIVDQRASGVTLRA